MRTVIFAAFGAVLGFSSSLAQGSEEQVSPAIYRGLTCLQIAQEGRSISRQGFALAGLQAGSGGSDGSDTASAIVIVWPAPSRVSDEKRVALAQADRQMTALEEESVVSQCSIQFRRPPKG